MVQNSLVESKQNQIQDTTMTGFLNRMDIKANIEQALGKGNVQRFISGVVSAVSVNPALAECTKQSILSGALLGESLKLSPSPQLGHYYLVPYSDNKAGTKVAQFQMGYKGYIQLAIRSGQYKKLTVLAIKEGEFVSFDPMNEEINIQLMVNDWDAREKAETVGYYAMFELVNGFRKSIYWSKNQMLAHANRYSQAFSKDMTTINTKYGVKHKVSYLDYVAGNYDQRDSWMYSSFWYKNFDAMAYKTMLRQLISKWGIMSIEMQSAFESDMAYIKEDGSKVYVDNEQPVADVDATEPSQPVEAPKEQVAASQQEEHAQVDEAEMPTPEQVNNSAAAALFG